MSCKTEVPYLRRFSQSDETLPNFMKRKHPRKGEKKKQRARTKVQANKQPKRDACHTKVREPLSIETSTSHMKPITERKGSKAPYLFSKGKGWSINKVLLSMKQPSILFKR